MTWLKQVNKGLQWCVIFLMFPPRCVSFRFDRDGEGKAPPRCVSFRFGHDEEGLPPPCHVSFCFECDGEGFPPPRRVSFRFDRHGEGEAPPRCISFRFGHDKEGKPLLVVSPFVLNATRRGCPPSSRFLSFWPRQGGESPSSLRFFLFWTRRGGASPSSSHFLLFWTRWGGVSPPSSSRFLSFWPRRGGRTRKDWVYTVRPSFYFIFSINSPIFNSVHTSAEHEVHARIGVYFVFGGGLLTLPLAFRHEGGCFRPPPTFRHVLQQEGVPSPASLFPCVVLLI